MIPTLCVALLNEETLHYWAYRLKTTSLVESNNWSVIAAVQRGYSLLTYK